MTEYPDEYVAKELRDGSHALFCYLYDKYYTNLNRFAFHIVMCDDSHDIVNDVFVNLWKNHKTLPTDLSIKSYLYTAVRNSALNNLKHRNVMDSRREKIVEAMIFIYDDWRDEGDSLIDTMNRCIDELPQQQQKIIRMKYDGMSHIEIAAKLNISTKTVSNHIFSAYKYIRKNILSLFFTF